MCFCSAFFFSSLFLLHRLSLAHNIRSAQPTTLLATQCRNIIWRGEFVYLCVFAEVRNHVYSGVWRESDTLSVNKAIARVWVLSTFEVPQRHSVNAMFANVQCSNGKRLRSPKNGKLLQLVDRRYLRIQQKSNNEKYCNYSVNACLSCLWRINRKLLISHGFVCIHFDSMPKPMHSVVLSLLSRLIKIPTSLPLHLFDYSNSAMENRWSQSKHSPKDFSLQIVQDDDGHYYLIRT